MSRLWRAKQSAWASVGTSSAAAAKMSVAVFIRTEDLQEGNAELHSPSPRRASSAAQPNAGRMGALSPTKERKETAMRTGLLPATLALTLLAAPAVTQTQGTQTPGSQTQGAQPDLSSDHAKPQQNMADEAAVRGDLAKAKDSGDEAKVNEAEKQVEDAAVQAKQRSDSNTGASTGSDKPQ